MIMIMIMIIHVTLKDRKKQREEKEKYKQMAKQSETPHSQGWHDKRKRHTLKATSSTHIWNKVMLSWILLWQVDNYQNSYFFKTYTTSYKEMWVCFKWNIKYKNWRDHQQQWLNILWKHKRTLPPKDFKRNRLDFFFFY